MHVGGLKIGSRNAPAYIKVANIHCILKSMFLLCFWSGSVWAHGHLRKLLHFASVPFVKYFTDFEVRLNFITCSILLHFN